MSIPERLAKLTELQARCECGHQKLMHPKNDCLWVSNYIPCPCKKFKAINV
jgi:hypothetical protein